MSRPAKALSMEDFEALRRSLKVKRGPAVSVAKARLTVARPATAIDPWDYYDAQCKKEAGRWPAVAGSAAWETVACLDLSMAKTGVAWGRPGSAPAGTALVKLSGAAKKGGEGARLLAMAEGVAAEVKRAGAGRVFFAEFFSSKFMLSFRASAALRGAVMSKLAESGVEAVAVAEISARKAAGVDVSGRRPDEQDGYMKARAKERLEALGLGGLSEDEGDAAILLLGASAYLPAEEVRPAPAAAKEKYDLSLLT